MRALEHEHRLAARERVTLKDSEARMQQREDALRQREETFKRRLNEELNVQVARARKEIDEVIACAESQGRREIAQARAWSRPATPVRRAAKLAWPSTFSRALANAGEATATTASPEPPAPSPRLRWQPRHRRRAGPSKRSSPRSTRHADLDVRGKRMRASVRDMRVIAGQAPAPRVNVNLELQPRYAATPSGSETSSAAPSTKRLTRAERFLDESLPSRPAASLRRFTATAPVAEARARRFLQQHPLGRPVRDGAAQPGRRGRHGWWS